VKLPFNVLHSHDFLGLILVVDASELNHLPVPSLYLLG
jgi:hypothetical protein